MSNSVHEVIIYKNDNGGVNLSVRVESNIDTIIAEIEV